MKKVLAVFFSLFFMCSLARCGATVDNEKYSIDYDEALEAIEKMNSASDIMSDTVTIIWDAFGPDEALRYLDALLNYDCTYDDEASYGAHLMTIMYGSSGKKDEMCDIFSKLASSYGIDINNATTDDTDNIVKLAELTFKMAEEY